MFILVLGLILGVHTRIVVNVICAYSYLGSCLVYILVLGLIIDVHTRIGVNVRFAYSYWG